MVYEQEVFCEAGAWKNFHDLEESLSLDELIVLYEASAARQRRLHLVMAAAVGAEVEAEDEQENSFLYSDQEKKEKPKKHYQNPWEVDPNKGGEITPAYGEEEVNMLPIGLGYDIIENEAQ